MNKTKIDPFLFALLVLTLSMTGCKKLPVESSKPKESRIESSFREPARTRLENTYLVTMPVTGRIDRVQLAVGDSVKKGMMLVQFDLTPLEKSVEELTARLAELKAGARDEDIEAAKAAVVAAKSRFAELKAGARAQELSVARATLEQAQANLEYRKKEMARMERLRRDKTMSEAQYEEARLAYRVSVARLKEAKANFQLIEAGTRSERLVAAEAEMNQVEQRLRLLKSGTRAEVLKQAAVRLAVAQYQLDLAPLKSPINGVVLERYEQGSRFLNSGHRLMLLGNLDELEVEADVLTQDALLLKNGSPVRLEISGSEKTFQGKVRRVEPAAFTKVSALGVEQQRVKVIVALDKRPEGLGVGYRLHARFITAAKEKALVVPRFSILQAADGQFYVFKIVGGTLKKQFVKIGLRSDLLLEVIDGLSLQDDIVSTPDANMKEGEEVSIINKK